MSRSLYTLHHSFRRPVKKWLAELKKRNIEWTITSTRRTRAQQARLYARFLAGKSKFPALPPGNSRHEFGLAIDIVFHPEAGGELAMRDIERLAAIQGFRWAGPGDSVHWDNRPPRPPQKIT